MCGKVVRKEGMGRDSSKLQYKVYKPDLHNTECLLRASMAVWENAHACDFTQSEIASTHI